MKYRFLALELLYPGPYDEEVSGPEAPTIAPIPTIDVPETRNL
jgi:hypothetical protein